MHKVNYIDSVIYGLASDPAGLSNQMTPEGYDKTAGQPNTQPLGPW